MEINGTEVGLGIGALITSVLAFFGLKPKKEDPMQTIKKEIEKIHGRQDRFEDALKALMRSSNQDITEIKEDVKLMAVSVQDLVKSVARLNAFQEIKSNEKKA